MALYVRCILTRCATLPLSRKSLTRARHPFERKDTIMSMSSANTPAEHDDARRRYSHVLFVEGASTADPSSIPPELRQFELADLRALIRTRRTLARVLTAGSGILLVLSALLANGFRGTAQGSHRQ